MAAVTPERRRMTRLDRMIASSVLGATILVAGVFLILNMLIELVSQLSVLDQGQYHVPQMLLYVLLLMPYRLILFFPVASLLGAVVGLNHLAASHALVVIRTSGVSVMRIARAVLIGMVPFLALVMILSEGLGPKSEVFAKTLHAQWISDGRVHHQQTSYWWRDGNAFFHATANESGHHLKRVMRFAFDGSGQLIQEDTAASAAYKQHAWTLNDLNSSLLHKTSVQQTSHPSVNWASRVTPNWLALNHVPPEKQNIIDLIKNLSFREDNQLESESLKYALWRRVFQPVISLLMALMGLPFVMGPLRERGAGVRVGAAVLFGVGAYVFSQFLGPLTLLLRLPPLAAAVAPALLLSVLSWICLRKVR